MGLMMMTTVVVPMGYNGWGGYKNNASFCTHPIPKCMNWDGVGTTRDGVGTAKDGVGTSEMGWVQIRDWVGTKSTFCGVLCTHPIRSIPLI